MVILMGLVVVWLCGCMHACLHVHVYIYICVGLQVVLFVGCMYMFDWMCVCIYMQKHIYISAYVFACMSTFACCGVGLLLCWSTTPVVVLFRLSFCYMICWFQGVDKW